MQNKRPLAPLQRAFAIFFIGLLAVLFIGTLRQLLPATLYADPADAETVTARAAFETALLPPWPFQSPHLLPGQMTQAAQIESAAITSTQPISSPTPAPATATPATVTLATEDALPAPTATPLPTTPPTPTPTPQPSANLRAVQPSVHLTGLDHMWQTWNNCGAATLAMNLSYFGSNLDQGTIGDVLRPHEGDKNVDPEQMVDYARSQGYHAQLRVNGSADLARQFLSNGIPVLIETWLEESPNDGLGHFRLLVGYEEANRRWIGYDSYVSTSFVNSDPANYQGIYMPYDQTDAWWQVFNYTYILVYPPEQEPVVQAILGDSADPEAMWQASLARAQERVNTTPENPFAHFNLGTNLLHYEDYAGAAAAFDRARHLELPWRMLWYQFGPFEAYYETGRYQEVIDLAQSTLNSAGGNIEELHYWKGRALAAQGNTAAARAEWEHAVTLNPDFTPAQNALQDPPS